MPKTPETSTSRSALDVAGAALDLADEAITGGLSEYERLRRLATILRAARDLRPYQVEEVVSFLASRLGTDLPDPTDGKADGAEPLGQSIADLPERMGQTG